MARNADNRPHFQQHQEKTPSFEDGLNTYLASLYQRLNWDPNDTRIAEFGKLILERTSRINRIAEVIHGTEYQEKIVAKEKELKGNCKTGAVICVDGRNPIIHLLGRVVNVWETLGAEIEHKVRGELATIDSAYLTEAIIQTAKAKTREFLELLFGHMSLTTDLDCGAKIAQRNANPSPIPKDTTIEDHNLTQLESLGKAITLIYNEARKKLNFKQATECSVAGTVNTDDQSFIFGWKNRLITTEARAKTNPLEALDNDPNILSTAVLAKKYKPGIETTTQEGGYGCGSFKDKFYDPEYFMTFSLALVQLTERLMLDQVDFQEIRSEVNGYLNKNYPDLSSSQQQALRFVILRNVAFQHLTGLYNHSEHAEHPFAEHGEDAIVLSVFGKTGLRFDRAKQNFGGSPANIQKGVDMLKAQIGIMNHEVHPIEPKLVFISNPVTEEDYKNHQQNPEEGNVNVQNMITANAEFIRAIAEDPELRKMLEEGKIVLVPILVDTDDGKAFEAIDQSFHII